jgi:FkbM family methyltransferase
VPLTDPESARQITTMNTATATTGVPGPGRKWKLVTIVLILFILLAGFFIANAVNPAGTQRRYLLVAGWWYDHWPLAHGGSIFFRLNDEFYSLGIMKPVQVTLSTGINMELDGRDLVTQTILMNGMWEAQESAFLDNNLKPGDVFVDVGAHVGYYTLLAAKLVGESGKVVAVEPNPPTIVRLEKDIALNPFKNIVVQKVACTDKETTLKFFQAPVENTGESSMNKSNAKQGAEISVRGVPLDKIIQDLGIKRVDLVKIDVEGGEMSVLGGMTHIIATYHPKFAIELKDDLLKNMGSSLAAAKALFLGNGYTLQAFDGIDNYYWVPAPQPAR